MKAWGLAWLWSSSYTKRIFSLVAALLFAVVILSAVASYIVLRNQISKMATERTLVQLHRTATAFSTLFASSIIPAAEQVYETSEVNRLIYGGTITNQQLLVAVQLLDRFQLSNPLVDSIDVYNHHRQIFYSTRYGLVDAGNQKCSVMMGIFRHIKEYRLYRFIPRQEDGKRLLTVIFGIPPYKGTELFGGLVVNLNEDGIRNELLGNAKDDGSQITIADSSGTILCATVPELFGTDANAYPILKKAMSQGGESGSFTATDGGVTSLVSFYRERLVGWTFVSSTPSGLLFDGIARWRNEIILLFSVLLVLSMISAMTASRRMSLPMERLMIQARALQADLSLLGSSGSCNDDILLVSETMDLLNQRLHDLSSVWNSDERAFVRVLLDLPTSEAEFRQLRHRLFDVATGEVSILALVIDGLDAPHSQEWRSMVEGSCRELTRRLMELQPVLSAGEVERGVIAAAVEVNDVDGGFVVPDVVTKAVAAEIGPIGSITIGVSDAVSGVDELSLAYDSAMEAVRYRFRAGRGAIITQLQRATEDVPYVLPDAELRRLGEQARLLNETAVQEVIQNLLIFVRRYSYEDFVFLSQNILHVLERVFADSKVMSRRDLTDYRAHVLNVKWIETTDDVLDLAMLWFRRFVATSREGGADKHATLMTDVRKFIELSLSNPDISSESIASRLRISVNYLRTMFKNATGESIPGYITRLRIERSKELLKNSNLTVKEVSIEAGFRNHNYFFTLFKKQTGRTPQEYQRGFSMK